MKRTIILNGPPRSGKDTFARIISAIYGYEQISFKDSLFDMTCEYYNIDKRWFMEQYDINKEKPQKILGDLSKRQALIYVSEEIAKPTHGDGVFGAHSVKKMMASDKEKFVFSDGGFVAEFQEVQEYDNNVALIQIYRPGCTFEGDSRSYLPDSLTKNTYHLCNDLDLPKMVPYIMEIVDEINKEFLDEHYTGW